MPEVSGSSRRCLSTSKPFFLGLCSMLLFVSKLLLPNLHENKSSDLAYLSIAIVFSELPVLPSVL